MAERKLFAGARLRRFRKGMGLTQSQMAADLGVSASYLTLIERDQRPVSARLLLQLAQSYDLDLRAFAAETDARLVDGLAEAAADPILASFELSSAELRDVAASHPRAAEAFVRLHAAYRESLSDAAAVHERAAEGQTSALGSEMPLEEVRAAIQARDNHFPELEAAADGLREDAAWREGSLFAGLGERLERRHGVTVTLAPDELMGGELRRFDLHGRRLFLSERLAPPSRAFQLCVQAALLEAGGVLDRLTADAQLGSVEARRLYRVSLANYLAAALMTPYEAFLEAAVTVRYDLDALARRFSASVEQVCHRLTTLHRPGARGVAFFLLRLDHAGNVSKRFGGRVFHFARAGGACPRWNVFETFREPGRFVSQLIETPDGRRYFSVARALRRPPARPGESGALSALAIGCATEEASALIYADGWDLSPDGPATPIGVTCRLCERPDCEQRAHPPLRRPLIVDERRRTAAPFAFRGD